MRNNSLKKSSDHDISFDGSFRGDISFDNDSSHEHRKLEKSTNPFDSSDSSDSSDDDDTCFYQECNEIDSFRAEDECEEESIFSEVTTPTILESTHTGTMDDAGNDISSIGMQLPKSKRVAPLSFLVQTVDARPALDFDSAQHSIYSDFVSPLETAMTNQVDDLKGGDDLDDSDCDQDKGGDKDDDGEQHSTQNVNLVAAPSMQSAAATSEGGGYFSRIRNLAPLSFLVQTVDAKPALDFDDAQHSNHSKFASPLETAMINQVDDSKAADDQDNSDCDQEKGGDKDDDGEQHDTHDANLVATPPFQSADSEGGGYFSRMKNLSSYMYFNVSKTEGSGDNDATAAAVDEHMIVQANNKISQPKRETSQKSFQSSKSSERKVANLLPPSLVPTTVNVNRTAMPLEEAEDVLQRMDIVEVALKKNAKNRRLKSIRRKKKASFQESKNVLKKINPKDSDLTMDHRHSSSPWNRVIILEELGTASSWIILLLPYLAFFLAVGLDARTSLWETTSVHMRTNALCGDLMGEPNRGSYSFPVSPLIGPCSYAYTYESKEKDELASTFRQNAIDPDVGIYGHEITKGVAFSSGPMTLPVLSTFMYGDVHFSPLSIESVRLLSKRLVHFSTVVMQQNLRNDTERDTEWFPVSRSKTRALAMICNRNESNSSAVDLDLQWSCESPHNIKVLFSLPDTSILTGGSVRVETIISLAADEDLQNSTITKIEIMDALPDPNVPDDGDFLMEIAQSASYQFTHTSNLRTTVLIWVRVCSLLLTMAFMWFWFWCMGIDGFFFFGGCSFCNCFRRSYISEEEMTLKRQRKQVLWWQCPWILFPERRYLLLLLVALLLLQNPVFTLMYFYPSLYSSIKMRVIADSLVGIGFHSILCLWMCLCEGLRYHTARSARRRAEHQKQILELRRATNFLASSGVSSYSTIGSPSNHLTSYFDEFGDMHNAGPSAWINLRLEHDMCGDGWADFLLPKVFLFLLGAGAVVVSSLFRFSYSILDDLSFFREHRRVFIVSSVLQIAVLALWAVLIIRAALKTGALLRKEPFLSTRPAQLAYRVLMSILVLGVTSFLVPLSTDMLSIRDEYSTMRHASSIDRDIETSEYSFDEKMMSLHDILMAIVLHAMQRFPYSGTAASLGPGEIIFCTIATLVVAFIFLPSTSFILDEDHQPIVINADGIAEENQRRDKRDVLTMAKYTHTWRAFPMPIERHKRTKHLKVKAVEGYQLDKIFRHLQNDIGRGTIYKGNYIPLYCVETALWLAECSWQTYYSSSEYKTDDFAPGVMNLDFVGLELEADIYNEQSDIRAFVASNISGQVDGECDSIIVVAFRGTCSTKNLATDLNWGQESLPESFLAGAETKAEFQINVTNTFDAESGNVGKATLVQNNGRQSHGLIHEADHILRSAPVTRLAFPCVHSGFIEAYNLVRDEIIEKVIEVLERQIDKAIDRCHDDDDGNNIEGTVPFVLPKIYVTGHSLGGALGQLLALDISCNVEIIVGQAPKLSHPKHSRGVSDGVGLQIQKALSDTSPSRSLGNSEEIETILGEERPLLHRPLLHRRHSFTSQRSVASTITVRRAEESVQFVHGLLSGIGFAGDKNRSKRLRPPIAVYTFGQPRVGNHAFARFYKANVPHTFRVVSEGDAITSLPLPTSCPPALYKHAGLEVLLDEGSTGNIIVGPTVVETLFRFSKVRTNLFAHLMEKYRDGLESALTHDELQEVYRTHGVNSRSIRSGYNTSDLLPDWVTHISRRNF